MNLRASDGKLDLFEGARILNKKELLLNEIEDVSGPILDELIDFVQFLKSKKSQEKMHLSIASESSLKKDWLKPKEDKAWQNL